MTQSTGNSKALIGLLLAGLAGIGIFLFVQLSGGAAPPIGTKTGGEASLP